jgi:hypothetical protein
LGDAAEEVHDPAGESALIHQTSRNRSVVTQDDDYAEINGIAVISV